MELSMTSVPVVPTNVSLPSLARILEDDYGVPWELLNRFADKVAQQATRVAETAISEFQGDWLDW
jgi:hypothetical protein